jgi:hypothetical protein
VFFRWSEACSGDCTHRRVIILSWKHLSLPWWSAPVGPGSGRYGEPTVPVRVPARARLKRLAASSCERFLCTLSEMLQSCLIGPQIRARLGSRNNPRHKQGVSDGGLDAQALRFEGNIGSRTVGVHGAVRRFAGPDCLGVSIEEPFSGQFSSVEALFPMLGAAVLACELAGLRWSAVDFSKLKLHAIGKGNAKKPDMRAAAKAGGGKRPRRG